MKVYILQLNQDIKYKDGSVAEQGSYVGGDTWTIKGYTKDIDKARIYKSFKGALLSANNGCSLKRKNGYQRFHVIERTVS
jgi:hypothetical protein